ncbi:hypothetical protein [Enorma sp.]|uniref:hypothetical protein n=1 Tax=Enorma sp. TaxID=1920692 RepID=UPI0025C2AC17|nr:hypothetical protein [Enorma sp.]
MPYHDDLSYEKRETKTLSTITDATDIDEALEMALYAIYDAQSFREYAKATGVDVVKVKKDIGVGAASGFFAAGVAFCAFVLWCLGVI